MGPGQGTENGDKNGQHCARGERVTEQCECDIATREGFGHDPRPNHGR